MVSVVSFPLSTDENFVYSSEDEIPAVKLRNYYKSISEHKDVTKLLMVLTSAISSTKAEVISCLERFNEYQFVWEEDKEKTVAVSNSSMTAVEIMHQCCVCAVVQYARLFLYQALRLVWDTQSLVRARTMRKFVDTHKTRPQTFGSLMPSCALFHAKCDDLRA